MANRQDQGGEANKAGEAEGPYSPRSNPFSPRPKRRARKGSKRASGSGEGSGEEATAPLQAKPPQRPLQSVSSPGERSPGRPKRTEGPSRAGALLLATWAGALAVAALLGGAFWERPETVPCSARVELPAIPAGGFFARGAAECQEGCHVSLPGADAPWELGRAAFSAQGERALGRLLPGWGTARPDVASRAPARDVEKQSVPRSVAAASALFAALAASAAALAP